MGETRPARRPDTQLYNDVFNASPIGIVVENLDGQPLFVNPAFCSMLGFSEDELRSKHCVDYSPPEDAGKDWILFQQLGGVHRSLPTREALFSTGRIFGVGSLEYLFIKESLNAAHPCDGRGHHR